jgi:hypothetical protein
VADAIYELRADRRERDNLHFNVCQRSKGIAEMGGYLYADAGVSVSVAIYHLRVSSRQPNAPSW